MHLHHLWSHQASVGAIRPPLAVTGSCCGASVGAFRTCSAISGFCFLFFSFGFSTTLNTTLALTQRLAKCPSVESWLNHYVLPLAPSFTMPHVSSFLVMEPLLLPGEVLVATTNTRVTSAVASSQRHQLQSENSDVLIRDVLVAVAWRRGFFRDAVDIVPPARSRVPWTAPAAHIRVLARTPNSKNSAKLTITIK